MYAAPNRSDKEKARSGDATGLYRREMRIIVMGLGALLLAFLSPLLIPLQLLGLIGYRGWEHLSKDSMSECA